MHAQTAGVPDLTLQAIDDGLTVLGVLLAGPIEQKNVSPVHPRRAVERRTRLLEAAKFLAEFPAFSSGNELGNTEDDKPYRGRDQSPIAVLVIPRITRPITDFRPVPLQSLGTGEEPVYVNDGLHDDGEKDRVRGVFDQVSPLRVL